MRKIFLPRGAIVFASGALSSCVFMIFSEKPWLAALCAFAFVALACSGMFFFDKTRRGAVLCCVLCAIAALAGALSSHAYAKKTAAILSLCDGDVHSLSGKVTSEIYSENFGGGYYVVTESGGVYIETSFAANIAVGDKIDFSGIFSPLEEDRAYLRSKGIFAACEAEATRVAAGGGLSASQRVNSFFREVFFDKLPDDVARLASAVFLGNREDAMPKMKLDFRRAGASHLLALSGLHLSIVSFATDFFLRAIKVKRKIRTAVMILFVALFASVTGLSPSVFRAAIMLGLVFSAELIGERADPITSLFVSLAVIFLFRPYAVYDAGLWLSFSATLGIICFADEIKIKFRAETRETYSGLRAFFKKAARYFFGLLSVGIIATVFTLPITCALFGGISLLFIVTNIVAIPLVTLLLYGLILLCALFWIPVISTVISGFCTFVSSLILKTLSAFSSVKGVYISLKYPFAPYIVAALAICVALILLVPKIKKKYIFAAALSACVAFAACFFVYSGMTKDKLYVACVNAGQNDAVSMVYRGKSVVLDISSGGFSAPYKAISETEGRGADELDALVLTHLHSNHVRTFEKLTGYVKINMIAVPYPEIEDEYSITSEIENVAAENGVELIYYDRSTQSYLDIADMTLALPMYFRVARSTHPTVFFEVTFSGNPAFMYVGSSLWESAGSPRRYDSTVILFGAHGPILKSVPKSEMYSADCVLYSNESVGEIFCAEKNIISSHGGKITLIIEK